MLEINRQNTLKAIEPPLIDPPGTLFRVSHFFQSNILFGRSSFKNSKWLEHRGKDSFVFREFSKDDCPSIGKMILPSRVHEFIIVDHRWKIQGNLSLPLDFYFYQTFPSFIFNKWFLRYLAITSCRFSKQLFLIFRDISKHKEDIDCSFLQIPNMYRIIVSKLLTGNQSTSKNNTVTKYNTPVTTE